MPRSDNRLSKRPRRSARWRIATERARVAAVESARDLERDLDAAVDELDAAVAAQAQRDAEHAEALASADDAHALSIRKLFGDYSAKLDALTDGQAATLGGMADAHAERIEDMKARHAKQLAAVRAEEAEKCGCSWESPLPPL